MSSVKINDASSFQAVINRLKEALGVKTNREVAIALGITPSNLGERKTRNALPREQIDELCDRMGESPTWVYTGAGRRQAVGRPAPEPVIGAVGQLVVQMPRGTYAPPLNGRLLASSIVAMEEALRERGLGLDATMRAKLVSALYEMSLRDGRVNPGAIQPLISLLVR